MSEPRPRVIAYTDGGADPNPGVGGWGAVIVDQDGGRRQELSGGEAHTTNNRMEMTAAIETLAALPLPSEVDLYTDSTYLRQGVTAWLPAWIARDWKRKDGGAVLNVDLWRRLAAVKERHQVRWHWVRGHSGNELNERADQLATAAIQERKSGARRPREASPGASPAASGRPDAPVPEVEVFLRVSCARTGGAWAALVRRGASEEPLFGAAANATTANRLDLVAATTALARLAPGCRVAIYTGSDYLRHGASRWLRGWRERGWITRDGQPLKNRELWQALEQLVATRQVSWPELADLPTPVDEALARILGAASAGAVGAAD